MGYIRDILGYTRDICIGIYWDILGDLEKSHHFWWKLVKNHGIIKFDEIWGFRNAWTSHGVFFLIVFWLGGRCSIVLEKTTKNLDRAAFIAVIEQQAPLDTSMTGTAKLESGAWWVSSLDPALTKISWHTTCSFFDPCGTKPHVLSHALRRCQSSMFSGYCGWCGNKQETPSSAHCNFISISAPSDCTRWCPIVR